MCSISRTLPESRTVITCLVENSMQSFEVEIYPARSRRGKDQSQDLYNSWSHHHHISLLNRTSHHPSPTHVILNFSLLISYFLASVSNPCTIPTMRHTHSTVSKPYLVHTLGPPLDRVGPFPVLKSGSNFCSVRYSFASISSMSVRRCRLYM